MTALLDTALGAVLANYADVIEGGNTWRGSGTVYKGIPGKYSNDPGLRSGEDSTLTVPALGSMIATKIYVRNPPLWRSNRWTPDNGPAFWAFGVAGNHTGRHRKITAYQYYIPDPGDPYGVFTVAPGFPSITDVGDTFTVLQGFKRVPNGVDIETDRGAADGWDRAFHLSALPGKVLNWCGDSIAIYDTVLRLRIRMCKFARLHDWTAAVMTNAAIIRQALVRREHYESSYTVALTPLNGECTIIKDDKDKVVVQDSYRLIYRVRQDFD